MALKKRWHKWHNKCLGCGTTEKKYQAKGRCISCYYKWRYENVSGIKERQKAFTYAWIKKHPIRWKKIMRKSIKKYNKNLKR